MTVLEAKGVSFSLSDFSWGCTTKEFIAFAEDLLCHICERAKSWSNLAYSSYDEEDEEEASFDDCAGLRRDCLEAVAEIGRIYRQVDYIDGVPDKEVVESVVCVVLGALTKCKTYILASLTRQFPNVFRFEFDSEFVSDSNREAACKELGYLIAMINGLQQIQESSED